MAVAGNVESMNLIYPTKADWHRSISTANSLMMSVKRTNGEIDAMAKQDFLNGTTTLMEERMSVGEFISYQSQRADAYKSFVINSLSAMDSNSLKEFRNTLSGQLIVNALNQRYNDGSDPTPQAFLDLSRENLLDIRKAVINELENRGIIYE